MKTQTIFLFLSMMIMVPVVSEAQLGNFIKNRASKVLNGASREKTREATSQIDSAAQKAATDAAHIALAAIHGIDYLMTWNCKHIANATIFEAIREICFQKGYACPVICTPEELLGD